MIKLALARLGLLVGTSLLLFLMGEVFVRATDTKAPGPGASKIWQKRVSEPPLNADNFREIPPGADVFEEGVTRVLFLGDSFTFAQGVPASADRFSDLVEARLNREHDDRRFHIYNAGIRGSWPDQWHQALETLLPKYRPHLVLAVFFLRDGTPIGTSLRFHRRRIRLLRAQYRFGFLSRHSKLVTVIGDRLAARDFQAWYLDQFNVAYLGTPAQQKVWSEMQRWLVRSQLACKKRGIPYHLSIFPLLFNLDDYAYGPVEDEIIRFAQSQSIPIMSLTPGFVGMKDSDLWVSATDQHPNEQAHQIAADTLYPYLSNALQALETSKMASSKKQAPSSKVR